MKYRLLVTRQIGLKDGTLIEKPGTVFDGADLDCGATVEGMLQKRYIEPVPDEPPTKATKEMTTDNAPRRGRKPKGYHNG